MTRAKNRLILTWARMRRSFAREGRESMGRSRFLSEIPPELLERVTLTPVSGKPRTAWDQAVNSVAEIECRLEGGGRPPRSRPGALRVLFDRPQRAGRWKLGAQVRHPKYGLGTIVDCEGEGEDSKLTVSFPGYGRKKMVERYASLEKV
jgi:DNA helicase-2/ATP-dependent DNA helicase PcrA